VFSSRSLRQDPSGISPSWMNWKWKTSGSVAASSVWYHIKLVTQFWMQSNIVKCLEIRSTLTFLLFN
jgi:hypothetical protein